MTGFVFVLSAVGATIAAMSAIRFGVTGDVASMLISLANAATTASLVWAFRKELLREARP